MQTMTWNWLQETFWYVPTEYLRALQFSPGESDPFEWASDQTLWHIDRYRDGYFAGSAYIRLQTHGSEPLYVCRVLIGSVTQEGNVYISFVPNSKGGAVMATTGIGRMRQQGNAWCFEMQMATGVTSLVAHWAWMMQCQPGDNAWEQLPGTDSSVPEFIRLCRDACSENSGS